MICSPRFWERLIFLPHSFRDFITLKQARLMAFAIGFKKISFVSHPAFFHHPAGSRILD
jgi:hypothetical protein